MSSKNLKETTKMPTISLCMIVKNEDEYLLQCLNSVKELVDEIVIIDTGSKDKTKEIAEEFKKEFPSLKILNFGWVNDFSSARNFSISYASCDWILFMDADECIDKNTAEKIKKLIVNNKSDGFMLVQRNYTDNSQIVGWQQNDESYLKKEKFTGYYPVHITRLFKNNKGFVFRRKVHENVDESIFEKKGKIKVTELPIHHFQYERGEEFVKQKQLEYFKICENILKERADFKAHFDMGIILLSHKKEFEKASEHFKKSIKLNPNYLLSYLKLGLAYEKLNMPESALEIYKRALSIEKNNLNLVHNIGVLFSKLNKPDLALKYLDMALRLNPRVPQTYTNIGCVFGQLQKYKEATTFFKKALELNPTDSSTQKYLEMTIAKIKK
ncbi:glycosyltransferase [Candidatus Woesearchaeota archaeon]|jgi:glycosyltransferase involved in cell wall biosynthesis|nr:glycosyltransferase [Candidatus Woesearchaeota archaeon]MBT6518488.1 glycosyltransferase [Candidatus Woesearchaeota archaeon]MBT7367000.1 glycosyltransferase [Candidatus Woesearchaeota archaeon]